jgi:hypothetical protein
MDIMAVLGLLGEFEWAMRRPAVEASGEELAYPPIIVWRYREPAKEKADKLQGFIDTFRGKLAWQFSCTRRNWGLMPASLEEYTAAHELAGILEAAEELTVTEPDFGKRANAELASLADHIHKGLQDRS